MILDQKSYLKIVVGIWFPITHNPVGTCNTPLCTAIAYERDISEACKYNLRSYMILKENMEDSRKIFRLVNIYILRNDCTHIYPTKPIASIDEFLK